MYNGLEAVNSTPRPADPLLSNGPEGNLPKIEVFEAPPQKGKCDGLPVMHVALARVVAQDPVNHNRFLTEENRPS